MYNTAETLEELDILDELNSYDSVGGAFDRYQFSEIEEEFRDVDFYIFMINDSEQTKISELLNSCGMTAWLDYEEHKIKIEILPPHRKISEILKEADATDSLRVLSGLWEEVFKNLRCYPLVEIEYAQEHLLECAGKLGKEAAQLFKQYLDLISNRS